MRSEVSISAAPHVMPANAGIHDLPWLHERKSWTPGTDPAMNAQAPSRCYPFTPSPRMN
jgi:hypothetical protein